MHLCFERITHEQKKVSPWNRSTKPASIFWTASKAIFTGSESDSTFGPRMPVDMMIRGSASTNQQWNLESSRCMALHACVRLLEHLRDCREKLPACNCPSSMPVHRTVSNKKNKLHTLVLLSYLWRTCSSVSPILRMRPFSMSLACPGILKPSRACKRGNKSQHLVSFVEISLKRKHRLSYLIMTCITPGIASEYRSTRKKYKLLGKWASSPATYLSLAALATSRNYVAV